MNENDLFNNDSMYWREVNFSSPTAIAELYLLEPYLINGEAHLTVVCQLLPFEAHVVEHDLDNGGSFTKNEVKAWPFVLMADLDFYRDENNPEEERQQKVKLMPHIQVQSIRLKDNAGNVIVQKEKI